MSEMREVARVHNPLRVSALNMLREFVAYNYGAGGVLHMEGDWFVIKAPVDAKPLDRLPEQHCSSCDGHACD